MFRWNYRQQIKTGLGRDLMSATGVYRKKQLTLAENFSFWGNKSAKLLAFG